MSVLGTSRSQCGHQRFCWMRVWHSPWSWLKLKVAPASVAGNTLTGMLTRLILRYPFQVGRAGIRPLFHRKPLELSIGGNRLDARAGLAGRRVGLAHLDRHDQPEHR